MNKITFTISYVESVIVTRIVTLMYISGPQFQHVKKSLSSNEQNILCSFDDRMRSYKGETQKKYPELFDTKPYYQDEAWNMPVLIEATSIELGLTIRAFEETIQESKSDNFYDLEIIVGYPIDDIRRCLELLQSIICEISNDCHKK